MGDFPRYYKDCEPCLGSGFVEGNAVPFIGCWDCNGKGIVQVDTELYELVDIEAMGTVLSRATGEPDYPLAAEYLHHLVEDGVLRRVGGEQ